MTKKELINEISKKCDITKRNANLFLETLEEIVKEKLAKEEEIILTGFGKFCIKKRASRVGRNPHTGKTIEIPAKKIVAFKVAKSLQSVIEN